MGPVCRLCRREGVKLNLKGERCNSPKCALSRRPYPPGRGASMPSRRSTYGIQLREKQKVKRIYGLSERQLKSALDAAGRAEGDKGLNLLQRLEMRLDNVVYLLGLAPSRPAARRVVSHGKINVNAARISVPSHMVKPGDVISVRDSRFIAVSVSSLGKTAWLKKKDKGGQVMSAPLRDMIDEGIRENLIIEFYSR